MDTSDSLDATRDFVRPGKPIRSTLHERFDELEKSGSAHWTVQYRFLKKIGSGSQSVVYLADRMGSMNVSLRIALKLFSPAPYINTDAYLSEMMQTAQVAIRIAEIQQDHLLDVHNFVEANGIQIMVMEWVDGFDLRRLVDPGLLKQAAGTAGKDRWQHINDVVATAGPSQVRFKPGVALQVLRECLTALSALERRNIIHGDMKPANVMLKRTGAVKLIDFGSAFLFDRPRIQPAWTPRYAAPEVIESGRFERNSDLASLGYVFLELLSGRVPFEEVVTRSQMLTAKRQVHEQLDDFLPRDVRRDTGLLELIRGMIHPNPAERFQSAAEADLSENGAAAAHRRLVLGDLSSEYDHDIREWLRFVPAADSDSTT
jgi:eukaryotic-like serine/threonine-protein kinase